MLFAIPVVIAAIAAYVPLRTLLSSTEAMIWDSPWTLGGVTRVILSRRVQAFVHDWAASWVIYFAPNPSPFPVKQPAVFFLDVDLVWGTCGLNDCFSVCIGPGYSFMPNIVPGTSNLVKDLVSRLIRRPAVYGAIACLVIVTAFFVQFFCWRKGQSESSQKKSPGLITAGENDSTASEEPDPKDSGDRSSPLESTEQEPDNSTPTDASRPDNSIPPEEWYQMFYGDRFRPNRTLSPLQRGVLPPGTVTFPSVGSPFSGTPKDPVLWRRPPVPGSRGFDPAHRGPRPANQEPSAGQSSTGGSGIN